MSFLYIASIMLLLFQIYFVSLNDVFSFVWSQFIPIIKKNACKALNNCDSRTSNKIAIIINRQCCDSTKYNNKKNYSVLKYFYFKEKIEFDTWKMIREEEIGSDY